MCQEESDGFPVPCKPIQDVTWKHLTYSKGVGSLSQSSPGLCRDCVCHGIPAMLSLLRGLPAHKEKLLQPILVLTVPLCGNQVT